ncbi:hypothetical protein G6F24_014363 [Rhizopus arrhizus]|nr:hypothetical protein G6F24_014363 [Rhizopus arrhizus]
MASMQRTAGRSLTRRSLVHTLGQLPDPGPVQRRRPGRRCPLSPALPSRPVEGAARRAPERSAGTGQHALVRAAQDLPAGPA